MHYPPAPWTLCGSALQTLQLVDTDRARGLVPLEVHVVSVLPGKTVACLYAARYGPGSTLEYDELIVAPALVRVGRHYGFWISHIYVNSPASASGGREIWGLPKELAEFTWDAGARTRVTVRQGDRVLCRLAYRSPVWLWRQPVGLPNLTTLDRDVLFYWGNWSSRMGLAPLTLDVPPGSPFATLGLRRYGLPYFQGEMTFRAAAPRVVAHTAAPARLLRQAPAGRG